MARAGAKLAHNSWPMPTACAPCPGNMNATFGMIWPRRISVQRFSGVTAQLGNDQLIDLVLGKSTGYSNGVANCRRARSAVADDANSVDSQERSAAVFTVVI